MSRFAISGTSSGLGKYLKKNLNSYKLHRNLKNINIINKNDTIIHCAFNKKKEIKYNELFNYYSDNFLFTSNLLKTNRRTYQKNLNISELLSSTIDTKINCN